MAEPYLRKGQRLEKDDSSGYIVTQDIPLLAALTPSMLEVYGDAETVVGGELIPKWLGPAIQKAREQK